MIFKKKTGGNVVRLNEDVSSDTVLLIGSDGEKLGVKSKQEAIQLALIEKKDLVEVFSDGKIATVKIVDYPKFRYEQEKRVKKNRKKGSKAGVLKEVVFSFRISQNDLGIKINQINKFLALSYKVKATLKFKGREMQFSEKGEKVMQDVIAKLIHGTEVEQGCKMNRNRMHVLLSYRKKKSVS